MMDFKNFEIGVYRFLNSNSSLYSIVFIYLFIYLFIY